MTSTHLIRFTQTLVLAAVVAALAAPAIALASSNSGKPASDWFERNDAAHPYGQGALDQTSPLDWFERYAAAHPYGQGVPDATHARAVLTDGRSPDTRDAAVAAQLQVLDGRSPDTLDAAQAVQPIELVSAGRFDWSDAGIGAGMGAALILLLGSSMLLLLRVHRRHNVRAT